MTVHQLMRAIDRRRQALGIGQNELCRLTGISVSTMSLWMCGKRAPNLSTLLLVMETLGLEFDFVVAENKKNPCITCLARVGCIRRCTDRMEYDRRWAMEHPRRGQPRP